MKKTYIIAISIVLLIAVGSTFYFVGSNRQSNLVQVPNSSDQSDTPSEQSSNKSSGQSNTNADTYSQAQVAKHNTASDCWTIIGNSVYNLTSYIARHPGGSVIVSACGTNGTEGFNNRNGRGESHSAFAKSELEKLKIGSLK